MGRATQVFSWNAPDSRMRRPNRNGGAPGSGTTTRVSPVFTTTSIRQRRPSRSWRSFRRSPRSRRHGHPSTPRCPTRQREPAVPALLPRSPEFFSPVHVPAFLPRRGDTPNTLSPQEDRHGGNHIAHGKLEPSESATL